ncbi:MAG: glycine zipper family protein [Thermodesulfobacteriota bacterium]
MDHRLLAAVLAGLVGCATAQPILYGNDKYRQVGRAVADRDIDECTQLADEAGATASGGRAAETAKRAGKGAVGGAAAGAVGGAIGGDPGAGAAAGAASGVVWTVLFGWMEPEQPDQVHRTYVDQCLTDRGYQVAGWR